MGNQALHTQPIGFELPDSVHQVDHMLRDGSPTDGWRGDPRLSLQMGFVRATKFGHDERAKRVVRKGGIVGWGWVVMRHLETGEDLPILQLAGLELPTIFRRLIAIDPRTPGFESTMDKVEREDLVVQKHRESAIAEATGEHLDHLWRLVDERENGRHTTRQVQGFDERPDRNLAPE